MSEYQYYEFQAIDRPLTATELATVRRSSTRARISPTQFVNDYAWGDFGADEDAWMERYFDAFLYYANWGTRVVQFRLPATQLSVGEARRYCAGDSAAVRKKGAFVIVTFRSERDDGDEWYEAEDVPSTLAALIPARAELAHGDRRALYLGWLARAQNELDDEVREPPVPPGLATLSAALEVLATYLRIGPDLLAAAAAPIPGAGTARTVGALMTEADAHRMRREAVEARREAAATARRARTAAAARAKHLDSLVGREAALWDEVERLVETKLAKGYDAALPLLLDLRDLMARGQGDDYARRLDALRERHATKRSFLARLVEEGLMPGR